jgi:hypothetical protein
VSGGQHEPLAGARGAAFAHVGVTRASAAAARAGDRARTLAPARRDAA